MALNTTKGNEILSYIINQDPILSENIDLPVQGKSIKPIGDIILNNGRYKNAFINALNLIAVTLITRNDWNNPWEEFTEQGKINFGQSVREMIVDLVEAQDYNEHMNSATDFLNTEVPDVYNYIYDINFQKFYKVTVNDSELAMAFTNESNLYDLIQSIYSRLYESYKYDKYIVDKYQLCRRIIDGTVPSVTITDFATKTTRQIVAFMKGYSNKLTFRSPNYNPAGLRKATPFDRQRLIVNTEFEGSISTEVLATSYFLNEADFKTKSALIDGFNDFDTQRLSSLLGDQYVAFTEGELTKLGTVAGMIISEDFFKDYYYSMDANGNGATKMTEFYNPETLDNTMWLHAWRIFSTSPFENAIVFTTGANSVTAVDVDPATATVTKGQSAVFTADVTTTGIANKSVQWTVDSDASKNGVTIDVNGKLSIPSSYVTGTQGIYTLTISTALATDEFITIDGIKYTATAGDNTATKQATAIKTLVDANTTFASKYTTTTSAGVITFTEKAGAYGTGKPSIDDSDLSGGTGVVAEAVTTQGVAGGTGSVTVTATSIYNSSVSDTATVTVA